ncbi:MAG: M42 family metallopeptidase, partial [Acutalibacteraceae bacterium]
MKNIELLEKLCMAVGISGEEDAVRALILEEIEPLADSVEITPLGNIIAFKKGEKRPVKKLMLCAHMDEVGLVVTNITAEGFLKFDTVGGVRPAVLSGRAVCVNGTVPGVICAKPIHLLKAEERTRPVPVDQLSIDIGASSREEAEAAVQIGDNVSFLPFFEASRGTVKAKALDDRAGCFVLIELMRTALEFDTYFVFSVQEEIGMRGAGTAACVVEPDAAIVLEGTTAG